MSAKDIVSMLTGIIVMFLIASAVLIPIVSNATADSDTYINKGYFDMEKFTADDTVTFEWNYANPRIAMVNDVEVDIPVLDVGVSIVLSSNSMARISVDGTTLSFYSKGNYTNANETTPNFDLTYTGGVITATNGTDTQVVETDALYMIVNEGSYVMKNATTPSYVKDDTDFCAFGVTYFGSSRLASAIWGTFGDYEYTTTPTVDVENFAMNRESVDSHVGLYLFESFTFDVTLNDVSKQVIYSYFAIEKEVTADRTEPIPDVVAVLLNIIPIFVVISIIVGIVFYFRHWRN